MKDNTIGIYIHIPFCVKKCPYCSFNSFEAADIQEDIYISAVLKELALHIDAMPDLSGRVLETIYIGGGTPSLISPKGIEKILNNIRQVFLPAQQLEITLEVNPGTVTFEKLLQFKGAGVNRISLGIQSLNENVLKSLGRIHSVRDSLTCFENSVRAGFNNIGIDLIYGVQGQCLKEWDEDINTAVSLRPQHISAYNLTIEKGTPFFRLYKDGNMILPSEEEQVRMFDLTIDTLSSGGYNQYEISNYSWEGFESRHNNRYWLCNDYIGLGAGAHSYLSYPDWGVRWWNETVPDTYVNAIQHNIRAAAGMEHLTEKEAVTEAVFLGLRRIKGIDLDWFSKRFGFSLKESCARNIAAMEAGGLLFERENRLILTRKGLIVADSVITELI